jgi:hypothetical protein
MISSRLSVGAGSASYFPARVELLATGTLMPIDFICDITERRIAPPANLVIAAIRDHELAVWRSATARQRGNSGR